MKFNEWHITTLGAFVAFILRLLKPAKESLRTIIWCAISVFVVLLIINDVSRVGKRILIQETITNIIMV